MEGYMNMPALVMKIMDGEYTLKYSASSGSGRARFLKADERNLCWRCHLGPERRKKAGILVDFDTNLSGISDMLVLISGFVDPFGDVSFEILDGKDVPVMTFTVKRRPLKNAEVT